MHHYSTRVLIIILIISLLHSQSLQESLRISIPTAHAADVTIDGTPHATEASFNGSSPRVVFTSDQNGYAFYVDSGGNCVYSKTANGGTSWGSAVQVDSVNTSDCLRIAVWYDKWTPGDSGVYVHISTFDSGVDDLYYTRLDTSDDSLSTTVLATTQGGTLVMADNIHSITKGTDGKFYMAVNDASDSWIVRCSTTCTTASNWAEITNPFSAANDWPLLLPLASGSIMAIRMDLAGNDYDYRTWNGSAWSASWTTILSTSGENVTYDGHFGATLNLSSNDLYLAVVTDNATLGTDDDIKTATYNGSWTTKTDVLTNDSKGITNAKIARDENTGDLYVTYSARTTAGTAATGNVYYKKSTDGMANWGDQTQFNDTADDLYGGGQINIMSNERLYGTWDRGAANDDFNGDTVVDISVTPTQRQNYFRFYQNKDAIQPDTVLGDENSAVTNIKVNQVIRIRMSISVAVATLASGQTYKLEYGQGSTCSAIGTWIDVGAIGSATIWRGYDNGTPTDGATITSTLLSVSDTLETYEEANSSAASPNAISAGNDGEWDWVVQHNGATDSTDYCFRMVKGDDSVLDTYTNYPKLTTKAGALSIAVPATADLSDVTYSFSSQASNDNALGDVNIIDDRGARPGWTVNISGEDWDDGSPPPTLDYNGNGTSTGQLCIDMAAIGLTVNEGESTGITLGTTDCFDSGTAQIMLVTASSGNGDGDFDVTGVTLDQFIPAQQVPANYSATLTFDAA